MSQIRSDKAVRIVQHLRRVCIKNKEPLVPEALAEYTVDDVIALIRQNKKDLEEKDLRIRALERSIKAQGKKDPVELEMDKQFKREKAKEKWERLKKEWDTKHPEQKGLGQKISDALHVWKTPWIGYDPGNEVLSKFIEWADKKDGDPREIYNIVTLLSIVDFRLFQGQEYVPTLSHTGQLLTKFDTYRNFFAREKIYYYKEEKVFIAAGKYEWRKVRKMDKSKFRSREDLEKLLGRKL